MENNEEYCPVKPKFYKYKAESELLEYPSQNINKFNRIYVCPYTINNEGKYPFIRYLLTNSAVDEKMAFQEVPLFRDSEENELLHYIKVYLFGLLISDDNYEKFAKDVEFKGYFEYSNNLYFFFDITIISSQINESYRNNHLSLVLIDEILNHKHICNIPINSDVSYFFTINDIFCFLLDENTNSYEIPIVGYVGRPENKLNFTYVFGESKSDKNAILGPFYYFTNFSTACQDIISSYNKCGVVRFATFLGNTKYFENHDNDIDESLIKSQRLQDENLNMNKEKLTIKLSDHDGKWSENYDSAYLSYIELDNGFILDKPLLALREYNQQIPISYHYISNKNNKFYIL